MSTKAATMSTKAATMSTKAALKAAKAAIDAKKWAEAIEQANAVLAKDATNYFANLFLGRASDALAKPDAAAKAYNDAIAIKRDEAQAWLGLRGLYEGLGPSKVDENTEVGLALAELYVNTDDVDRAQCAIDRLIGHARTHGTNPQYARALATTLPSAPSAVYTCLVHRLPDPRETYRRITTLHEDHEARTIKRLVNERRVRLGATLEGTTASVKHDVYAQSPLERIYEEIIGWTLDDELRREYEEKLLERAYATLLVLPAAEKAEKRGKVMQLAHDMVVIKHPYLLAWNIELEWRSGMHVERVEC